MKFNTRVVDLAVWWIWPFGGFGRLPWNLWHFLQSFELEHYTYLISLFPWCLRRLCCARSLKGLALHLCSSEQCQSSCLFAIFNFFQSEKSYIISWPSVSHKFPELTLCLILGKVIFLISELMPGYLVKVSLETIQRHLSWSWWSSDESFCRVTTIWLLNRFEKSFCLSRNLLDCRFF